MEIKESIEEGKGEPGCEGKEEFNCGELEEEGKCEAGGEGKEEFNCGELEE